MGYLLRLRLALLVAEVKLLALPYLLYFLLARLCYYLHAWVLRKIVGELMELIIFDFFVLEFLFCFMLLLSGNLLAHLAVVAAAGVPLNKSRVTHLHRNSAPDSRSLPP